MKLRPVSLAALALTAGLASTAHAQERKTYIVQLADDPAVAYTGGVTGLAATKPRAGTRFNFQATEVQAYVSYLQGRQRIIAAAVGGAPVIASYTTVLNGMALQLTDAEVQALRTHPSVTSIHADEALQLLTTTTPKFLGLTAPGGLWSQKVNGLPIKGEDVVIGVIDTGVSPENPAFADRVDANGRPTHDASGTLAYGRPTNWRGSCQDGPGFKAATDCNNKLIGAVAFSAGFRASKVGGKFHWTDFPDSPRDSLAGTFGQGGHGTHTMSTAGGNAHNPIYRQGVLLGEAAGMAPRARLASYKACWAYPYSDTPEYAAITCFLSDTAAAIERAVQDGVHVINYSISGGNDSVADPAEQAFLRAASAGIFVAAAAGNSGPGNAVAHMSPWVTTVAATTHDRVFLGDVTLGTGERYSGASLNTKALPATAMVLATAAKADGVDEGSARLCLPNSLNPAKAAGKIVVCTRGLNARVEKGETVAKAGGAGMVLVDDGLGVTADVHVLPTVHLSKADGEAVSAQAAAGAKAALSAFYNGTQPAPTVADFSSRGPNTGDANILKPDVSAPGVDVLAGYSADLTPAQRDRVAAGTLVPPVSFTPLNGTSMATPHVAGLAALLRQAHPDWSPMAIKSALMTTASMTLDNGLTGGAAGRTPWSQGAGFVRPNSATDPGLVFDAGPRDWTQYQCNVNKAGVKNPADCTDPAIGTMADTANLNLASIHVGTVVDTTVVTRRVTNVGASTATYTATHTGLSGFGVVVAPSSLTLAPGETKSFTVSITRNNDWTNVYSFGSLVWSDGSHRVRVPLAARAVAAVIAPAHVGAAGASGMKLVQVQTGFNGRITVERGGLKPVTYLHGTGPLAPARITRAKLLAACTSGQDTPAVKVHPVGVGAGTLLARFAMTQADVSGTGDDLDLMLLKPDGSYAYSAHGGANEAIELLNPAAGTYKLCVSAYRGGPAISYRVGSWLVNAGDAGGRFNVMLPSQVYANRNATVGLTWSGLPAAGTYVGALQFRTPSGALQAATAVVIDTAAVPPTPTAHREVGSDELNRQAK